MQGSWFTADVSEGDNPSAPTVADVLMAMGANVGDSPAYKSPTVALEYSMWKWVYAMWCLGGEYRSFAEHFRALPTELSREDHEELQRRSVGE